MAIMGRRATGEFIEVLVDASGRVIVVTSPAVPLAVDVTDRPARLVGIVYGNQGPLQQVPGTLELITQDTGLNTNPERYIQINKFSSVPVDRAGGVATLLYGVGSPAAHQRTAGLSTTIWWIYFYNHSGGAATVWLEAPAGTVMSGTVQLANNQGVILDVKPLDIGNQDIYVNASANNVQAQIGGIEV